MALASLLGLLPSLAEFELNLLEFQSGCKICLCSLPGGPDLFSETSFSSLLICSQVSLPVAAVQLRDSTSTLMCIMIRISHIAGKYVSHFEIMSVEDFKSTP